MMELHFRNRSGQSIRKACLALLLMCVAAVAEGQELKLFEPVPASKSGITFRNNITEDENHNALTHENLYNGGGVGTGDINNDGLDDVYFISNMRYNKLYLNLGGMKFKDITKGAGVEGREGWKTGVTMVDINGDNLLDIYVCYSGKEGIEKRRNQLFINKGNLKFEEQAKAYGLDDPTYSTQGAFFDYDLDGDLDMFLVATNVRVLRGLEFDQARVGSDPYAGDKLFRNDDGHFTDVTQVSGIISNALGYGLGVAVSDLNKDGWPDVYVTNDYIEPDYLYINNQDGTFTNRLTESVQHISQSAMGNIIDDFNNDTWPDIFTSDMLSHDNKRLKLLYGPENYLEYARSVMQGFYHSSMRNMLQLNNANGTFSEIGQLAGVSNTDWSWAPLFADYNNDGWKDLFVTNGYFKDYTNRDFLKLKYDYYIQQARAREKADTFYLTTLMTSTPVHNYMYRNNHNLTFTDKSTAWGFEEVGFSNGAAYSDLDNDGDMDLVVSNQNETASLYRNMLRETNPGAHYIQVMLQGTGKNTSALGSMVYVYTSRGVQVREQMPSRGYQSSVSFKLHFGLAECETVDSLVVEWPGGKASTLSNVRADQTIAVSAETGKEKHPDRPVPKTIFLQAGSPLSFEHTEYGSNDFNRQPLLPYMISICGPIMATGDVNGDGLADLFAGGSKESPGKLFTQSADGTFKVSADFNFRDDLVCTDADALFFDADRDGDQDLYVVSGGYHDYARGDRALQDRLYLNSGSGRFRRTVDALPQMFNAKSCVCAADIDRDGDMDLFVGGHVMPGEYPLPQPSYFLVNDGTGHFQNMAQTMLPDLVAGGMITDAVWLDLNRDSWPDLITVGEFMPVRVFLNYEGKIFKEATNSWFKVPESGFWNCISVADFDRDGHMDLLIGNFGTNSQLKASDQEPVELTYKDFDNNGTVDPIITYYVQNESYPFASRNEIITQISSMRRKFPTYESYSTAKITDMFSPEDLKNATVLQANELRTVLFRNTGSGFVKLELPIEAQFAPAHAIETVDYNHDGNQDFLLAGNKNAICVRLGVMDASYGQLFEGDGKGNFRYIPQQESGLSLTGDVRSLKVVSIRDKQYLFAGVSNVGIVMYEMKGR